MPESDSPLLSLPDIVLRPVSTANDLEYAKVIFKEYAMALGINLAFQDFDNELATLPGDYAAPQGVILLAFVDEQLAGCGAFRPYVDCDYSNACELKRLYVRPAFRGFGLGRQLTETLLECARSTGYSTVLLDTLDDMEVARELYESLHFEEIPPYYYNPLPGAHYLKVDLEKV